MRYYLNSVLAKEKPMLHHILYFQRNLIALTHRYNNLLWLSHRDIKPQNIFLTEDETSLNGFEAIFIDYAFLSKKYFSFMPVGTLQFLAPEVKYYKCYNRTVDVYALGKTYLFHILYFLKDVKNSSIELIHLKIIEAMLRPNPCKCVKKNKKIKVFCQNSDDFYDQFQNLE